MKSIVEHPALSEHFKKGTDSRNEQTIIDENGVILRPDRMVFNNKKATVIDYKTGDRHPSHKEQIMAYGRVLRNMGYTIENQILVYIQDSITTEFI
jgi:CRISPR/Cas system-associated exonuclease Cas4 (RecB family)